MKRRLIALLCIWSMCMSLVTPAMAADVTETEDETIQSNAVQEEPEIKEFSLINDENEKTSIFPDNSSSNDKVSIKFQKNSGNAIDVNIRYLERIDTGTWSAKNTAVVGNLVGYFEIDFLGNKKP